MNFNHLKKEIAVSGARNDLKNINILISIYQLFSLTQLELNSIISIPTNDDKSVLQVLTVCSTILTECLTILTNVRQFSLNDRQFTQGIREFLINVFIYNFFTKKRMTRYLHQVYYKKIFVFVITYLGKFFAQNLFFKPLNFRKLKNYNVKIVVLEMYAFLILQCTV